MNGLFGLPTREEIDSSLNAHMGVLERIDRRLVELVGQGGQPPALGVSDLDIGQGEISDFPYPGASRQVLQRAAVTEAGGVAVAVNSGVILDQNPRRIGLSLINVGSNGCTIGLGSVAKQYEGIYLAANGGEWDGIISKVLWIGALSAIADPSGATTLALVEL